MNDTFNVVEMADKLRRESNRNIIMRMVQQTTECAWFIRDYIKIGEFCEPYKIILLFIICTYSHEGERMAKNIMSSRKDQVDKFKSKFDELRKAFQVNSMAEIEITVLRVADDLESVKKDLDDMGM